MKGILLCAVYGLVMVLLPSSVNGEGQPFPGAPDIEKPSALLTEGINNPADIIAFQGRYVATELLTNRLAIFDFPEFKGFEYFDPALIGESFQSPHYMAVSPTGGLLISSGWGSRIVQIDNLKGEGWESFSGVGKKFSAPHGICVDKDRWIYVGDSLNSRLVRFKNMSGEGWQVFKDVDRKISYVRKLLCRDDGIWISNSYEDRPGLNPGTGSNILRVTDFESGRAEELYTIDRANITGILPLSGGRLLVGVWGNLGKVAMIDLASRELSLIPRFRDGLGIPYGFWLNEVEQVLFVTHTGALDPDDGRTGAIAVHSR